MSQVQLLELNVTADPSVLLRIVSLCHKRGIAIASLQYESLPGRLQLGLRCDAGAAGQAARWLDAIVPVLAVRPQWPAAGQRLTRAAAAGMSVSQSPPPLGTLAP